MMIIHQNKFVKICKEFSGVSSPIKDKTGGIGESRETPISDERTEKLCTNYTHLSDSTTKSKGNNAYSMSQGYINKGAK